MRMLSLHRARFAVLLLLFFLPVSVEAAWVARPGTVKVFARKSTGAARLPVERLRTLGAEIVDDQSTFVVLQFPLPNASAAPAILRDISDVVEIRDVFDMLQFPDFPVDARQPPPAYPVGWERLVPLPPPARDAFVLQFATLPQASWMRELTSAGVSIIDNIASNGFLVLGDLAVLQAFAERRPVQLLRLQQPVHKVSPSARDVLDAFYDAVVSVAAGPEADEARALIRANTLAEIRPPESAGTRFFHYVTVAAAALQQLAALPAVISIEPYPVVMSSGQREVHLTVGDTLVSNPGGILQPVQADHRAWINSKGVGNYGDVLGTGNGVKIAVLDNGFDKGLEADVHKDFKTATGTSFVQIKQYTTGPPTSNADCTGHGTLVAGVLAGNAGVGVSTTTKDVGSIPGPSDDYFMGLGIVPGIPLVAGRIINDLSGAAPGLQPQQPWHVIYSDLITTFGVGMATNSWNDVASPGYTTLSRFHDQLVRSPNGSANSPQMPIYFSAGNFEGPSNAQALVSAPATAKNVIAVGGSEGFNPSPYADPFPGPNPPPTPNVTGGQHANNGNEIWVKSQIGPSPYGRIKPDIVAPASGIEGPLTRYVGSCLSGAVGALIDPSPLSPVGEQHSWSRGTSFSAPLAAGAGALLYTWYRNTHGGERPTPALLKAMQITLARNLNNGVNGVGNPPDSKQGWGKADLERAFATDNRYVWVNESPFTLMTSNNQVVYTPNTPRGIYKIKDISKPVRATVVWTDKPGSTFGAPPLVNNLDLTVRLVGAGYPNYLMGNDFNAATGLSNVRTTGGTPDTVNNVEQAVFTNTSAGGDRFVVEVYGRAIGGDSIDVWNDSSTVYRQNFALFIENAELLTLPPGPFSFHTLQPCRVLDTRDPPGPYGGPMPTPAVAKVVKLWTRCGIPITAKAVAANLTVIGASGPGFLTAYPANIAAPAVSTMNYVAGLTRANNAVLALDALGQIALQAGVSGTHVLLDVSGYLE